MTRLDELINGFLDDSLESGERLELENDIKADPLAVEQLMDCYQQDRLLSVLCRPYPPTAIDAILTAVLQEDRFVDVTMRETQSLGLESSLVSKGPEGEAGEQRRILPVIISFGSWVQRFFIRPVWAFALAALVISGAIIWWLSPTVGEPMLAELQQTGLSLERSGQVLQATAGMRLQPGDVLRTFEKASATITFGTEKTRIIILPGTTLQLGTSSHGKRFALDAGKLEAAVGRQRTFRPMIITTPQAFARVLGTRFSLTVTTNATRLDVSQGKVRFTRISDQEAVKVSAGRYAVAAANYELAALPQTGGLLREWWSDVKSQTTFNLPNDQRFLGRPDAQDIASNFELTVAETNRLAVRLRGYLHPPRTGEYQFWLESDLSFGCVSLIMSPSESSSEAVHVAQTGDPGTTQAPPPIPLIAGRRYYIEVRVVIPNGPGHFSVAWKPPGASRELVTGEFLSPAKPKD